MKHLHQNKSLTISMQVVGQDGSWSTRRPGGELACTFPDRIWDWLKNNRRINDAIAMPPKTIEATGQENESKYRSGRGTGLLGPQG